MRSQFQMKGPRNPHNSEIYFKMVELRDNAEMKKNKHASFAYGKVVKSLEKYPLPIVSA